MSLAVQHAVSQLSWPGVHTCAEVLPIPWWAALLQLLDGAEAKAYWGLALNYKPLQALVDVLVDEETINGERLTEVRTWSSWLVLQ